LSLL
jgi:hypothetical protein